MVDQVNRGIHNVKHGFLDICHGTTQYARTQIHWLAPTLMFGNLVLGLGFAIGHHLFYASLAGMPAPTNNLDVLGTTLSQQQVNTALGTAMAFMVKSCFEVAISIAFVQVLFRAIRRASGGLTVKDIDTASSALTSVWSFMMIFSWIARNPTLIFLGVLSWLLPLASVVTPATLTIDSSLRLPLETVMARVPTLDFRSLAFASSISAPQQRMSSTIPETYTYGGPSIKLQGIANAVAASGDILPFASPYANASWNVQFPGPSLQCSQLTDQEALDVKTSIANWTSADQNCYSAPGYLAWMQNGNGSDITTPFTMSANTSDGNVTYDFSEGDWTASATNNANASLYLALLPGMLETESMSSHSVVEACIASTGSSANPLGTLATNASFIRCDLVNATYDLSYEVVNGNPTVKPEVEVIEPSSSVKMVRSLLGPDQLNSTKGYSEDCVRLIMEDGTGLDTAADNDPNLRCAFNEELVWRISYQSALLAFSSMIVGSVSLGDGSGNMVSKTSILSTALGDSKELAYLRQESQSTSGFQQNLQAALQATNNTRAVGLTSSVNATDGDGPSLIPTMEGLFRNLTISLLSSEDLLPNAESATAPPATNVTLREWQNIYTYSAMKLWLAYGLALLCAIIASIVGIFAIWVSGASYSNSFSAILRIARQAHLTVDVQPSDADGRDPLPEYIAKARVRFGGKEVGGVSQQAQYSGQESGIVDFDQKGAMGTWIPLKDKDSQ